jgi:hypothetical protein
MCPGIPKWNCIDTALEGWDRMWVGNGITCRDRQRVVSKISRIFFWDWAGCLGWGDKGSVCNVKINCDCPCEFILYRAERREIGSRLGQIASQRSLLLPGAECKEPPNVKVWAGGERELGPEERTVLLPRTQDSGKTVWWVKRHR